MPANRKFSKALSTSLDAYEKTFSENGRTMSKRRAMDVSDLRSTLREKDQSNEILRYAVERRLDQIQTWFFASSRLRENVREVLDSPEYSPTALLRADVEVKFTDVDVKLEAADPAAVQGLVERLQAEIAEKEQLIDELQGELDGVRAEKTDLEGRNRLLGDKLKRVMAEKARLSSENERLRALLDERVHSENHVSINDSVADSGLAAT